MNTPDDDLRTNYKITGFWGRKASGCLFIAEDTRRILFSHRSGNVLEPHTWSTWGGAAHEGEDPVVALIREVREEASINIENYKIEPVFVFKAPGFEYHNFIVIVPKEFSPILNYETAAWKWVEFGEWPTPLHPGTMRMFTNPCAITKIKLFV